MNDIKWLVLLTSQEPGVVLCELDKLGKLAVKTRTQIGQEQDVTVKTPETTAETREGLSTSTRLHQDVQSHCRIRTGDYSAKRGCYLKPTMLMC